ncbi:MAG: 3-hydroxyacyl-CoA dehydrogenase, partial [Lachnospiraceae bacterium]|nr:3-hydroxyacyl-CoA dehydrogenase [Lachnospiraceae bacterium]
MTFQNITIIGGGILGSQIGLMCAYAGKDVTFLLRSKDSIKRTEEKLKYFSDKILSHLERAGTMSGTPMWAYYCPPGLIKDRAARTPDEVKDIMALAVKRFRVNIKTELSREKACKDADLVIETMKEDPEAKAEVYESIKDLLPERAVIITNTSSLLPSMFADLTGRPENYCAVHFSNII